MDGSQLFLSNINCIEDAKLPNEEPRDLITKTKESKGARDFVNEARSVCQLCGSSFYLPTPAENGVMVS